METFQRPLNVLPVLPEQTVLVESVYLKSVYLKRRSLLFLHLARTLGKETNACGVILTPQLQDQKSR